MKFLKTIVNFKGTIKAPLFVAIVAFSILLCVLWWYAAFAITNLFISDNGEVLGNLAYSVVLTVIFYAPLPILVIPAISAFIRRFRTVKRNPWLIAAVLLVPFFFFNSENTSGVASVILFTTLYALPYGFKPQKKA